MGDNWDNYEPAPLEFYHGRFMELFHEWRRTVTEDTTVEINGVQLNNIVAKAKRETYAKYPDSILSENAILKTEFK